VQQSAGAVQSKFSTDSGGTMQVAILALKPASSSPSPSLSPAPSPTPTPQPAPTPVPPPPPPSGNIVAAASCSQVDVQSALAAVQSGGTVTVPAGNCAWSGPITVSKDVSIMGAGPIALQGIAGGTNITRT